MPALAEISSPAFRRIGGLRVLDLVNTVAGRGGGRARDTLANYQALIGWASSAGLVDAAAASTLAAMAARDPVAAAAAHARAIALRESVHDLIAAHLDGGDPADALAGFNRQLGAALRHARLAPADGSFAWDWERGTAQLEAMLWPLVREAADLLAGPELARVKRCAGPDCGWLFVDRSKNATRRWCDMTDCGTADKVRRFRARRRFQASGSRDQVSG